jgi:carbonic anhydrase/acetyltransferase-like protein (isoleucine patch superfamily)
MWGFRWFGVHIDFSSHLQDAWVDTDFIHFGRKITIGNGAVVMSSMIVGKYLIIKRIIFGDHALVGGVSNISPGAIIGKEGVSGAFSNINLNQVLEEGWIYIGLPAKKYKPNKYASERRDIILRKDVEDEIKYEVKQEVNIDEDKKHLLEKSNGGD